jgi:hypothetical protein
MPVASLPRTVLAVVAGVGLLLATGASVVWLRFPYNDDVVVRNTTSGDLLDVVVIRGEGDDAEEPARFPRIAPGAEALAHDGLGPISVEFRDARGRWTASRVLWRDDDDVRSRSEPELLEVTADAVGRVPVRRKP